jgi:hypothetical protein
MARASDKAEQFTVEMELSMQMNKKWIATAAILGASLSGAAIAGPATWTDSYDFTPDRLVTIFTPVVYTHDITGSGEFVVGVDTVDSYSLSFNLYDDKDAGMFGEPEIAIFSQPGHLIDTAFFNLSGSESGGWSLSGLWQIENCGRLSVAISALLGDFYLGDSTLTVKGTKNSVPEPGTLALFGAALLGFGLMRRKREA